MSDLEDLRVRLAMDDDVARVHLAGELDLVSAPRLAPVVVRVLRLGARRVMVDLQHLWFCDVIGVRQLAVAHSRWNASGIHVTLDGALPSVRQVFHLTGHGHLLPPPATE